MSYQVLNNSGYNDFVAGQYDGTGPIATELQAFFAGVSSVSVNTTFDTTANVNILTADGSGEIAVPTTSPEALQLVVDHGTFPATEDFDVSGNGSIAAFLTDPGNVDFSLTGSGNDTIIAGSGTDTIDGSGATDAINAATGNDTYYTGSGNETVTGGNGNDTFNVNYVPGFDSGANTLSITGGTGTNVANFNDNSTDATIAHPNATTTTVDFTAGQNAGQSITLSDVQTLNFLDGTLPGPN